MHRDIYATQIFTIPNSLNTVNVVLDKIGPLCIVLVVDDCLGKRFEAVLQCTHA